jgi:hypothetical protein
MIRFIVHAYSQTGDGAHMGVRYAFENAPPVYGEKSIAFNSVLSSEQYAETVNAMFDRIYLREGTYNEVFRITE